MLFIDNINANYLIINLVIYGRMKHIDIDFHFIQDLMVNNRLDMRYTCIEEQVADAMAKPIGESWFLPLKIKLMVPPWT